MAYEARLGLHCAHTQHTHAHTQHTHTHTRTHRARLQWQLEFASHAKLLLVSQCTTTFPASGPLYVLLLYLDTLLSLCPLPDHKRLSPSRSSSSISLPRGNCSLMPQLSRFLLFLFLFSWHLSWPVMTWLRVFLVSLHPYSNCRFQGALYRGSGWARAQKSFAENAEKHGGQERRFGADGDLGWTAGPSTYQLNCGLVKITSVLGASVSPLVRQRQ